MSSRSSENTNTTIISTFNKVIGYVFALLLAIIGWFINNKLSEIELKLQKIESLEQRVETLNKSQIQIMTHLKIPVPDYLFGQAYNEKFPFYPYPKNVIYLKNYMFAIDDKRKKLQRERKV
jgi:hypothetical protein